MRLNINLASQPYEAARRFRERIGMLVVALVLVTAGLIGYIIYQRLQSREINQQISAVQQEMTELNSEESQARATLNKPANRVVADQSQFLNDLFARKALSWTRVFSGMEKIMPPNLHVVSMKPEYTKNGDLMLHMVVATDSRDRAVELVRRMEKSTHFREPQIVAENVVANVGDQSAGPGNIQFDIASIYVPNVQDSEAENAEGKEDQATLQPNAPFRAAAGATPSSSAAQETTQARHRPIRERGH